MLDAKGIKILVVDDDPDIVEFLSYNLKKEGYSIYTTNNGREAIKMAQKVNPHLILLDIMMPEMDGYQTMREIRNDSRFRSLPILALTAKAMKGDREKCIDAGASDYIAKPVNTDQLLSLMRVWLFR